MEKPRHFIREWRKHRGLTMEQMATALGVSLSVVSRVERGYQPYSQGYLEEVAAALNCTEADLIVRDPSAANDLWSVVQSLSPAQQEQFKQIAKALKGADDEGR